MYSEKQQSAAATRFATKWQGKGYESSLADLYDELTMPPELRKANQQNDRAVMEAYGFPVKNNFTENRCVAELFKIYKTLTK